MSRTGMLGLMDWLKVTLWGFVTNRQDLKIASLKVIASLMLEALQSLNPLLL
ncbi:MAG: hypothetical protein ACYTXC_00690 [Nostoc sp.]